MCMIFCLILTRSRVEAAGRLVLLLIGTAYYFLLNLSLFVAHCWWHKFSTTFENVRTPVGEPCISILITGILFFYSFDCLYLPSASCTSAHSSWYKFSFSYVWKVRTPIGYIPCIRILVTAILFAYPLDCLVRLVARYLMGYPSQLLISFATGRDDDLDSNWKICHSSTGIDPRITFTVQLVLPPAIADHIYDRPGGNSCLEFFTYYDITNVFVPSKLISPHIAAFKICL